MNGLNVELMSLGCREFPSEESLLRYGKIAADEAVGDVLAIWKEHINTTPKFIFFYKAVLKTLEACELKDYTMFDAHTTSNCCHGTALLASELILSIFEFNLDELKILIASQIKELEDGVVKDFTQALNFLPNQLSVLTGLYVLAFVRTFNEQKRMRTDNEQKRMRTDARRLKIISDVGANFCWDLTNALKLHFSNLVANSYRLYADEIDPMSDINGIPTFKWGKYVQKEYIRVDKRNVQYASCIYSTQISLAYLIATGAKVVMVNDIINSSGEFVDRLIWVFQGDGYSKLRPLSDHEIASSDMNEPVVVFGGYVCSDTLNRDSLSQKMNIWQEEFPSLMMACDTFYPQFPAVTDDPDFNDESIIPSEPSFRKLLLSFSQVSGVSRKDPSLFCSSHTYPASMGQILQALNDNDQSSLPSCFHGLQTTHEEMWGVASRDALAK